MSRRRLHIFTGTRRSGIGFAAKSRWHGFATHRAERLELFLRALSVEVPEFAYICRYSLEMMTNASRPFSDTTQFERFQISGKL